ncbi:hypothetical protein ACMATS_32580 [Streptoverticillium reticulum]|uniref:hypothetical protein n=1 Tax=Streptoverticillium reticulum TaxID=1433415 RepID=UPI0039BEF009
MSPVSHRRGCAVWKAEGPDGAFAVKYGYGAGADAVTREAAALAALPGYAIVAAGRRPGGAWCVAPWYEGVPCWSPLAPLRARQQKTLPAEAVALCQETARLHELGWIHGDIQPAHVIHTRLGTRLIDFGWARRAVRTPDRPAYRGGISHLTAPETARAIAQGRQPAASTCSTDVFALAGTLWACLAGRWPVDYRASGLPPHHTPEQRRAVLATRSFRLTGPLPHTALQDLLRTALLSAPADRPSAAELAGQLGRL